MKNWAKNGRIPGKTLVSGIVLLIAQINVIATFWAKTGTIPGSTKTAVKEKGYHW